MKDLVLFSSENFAVMLQEFKKFIAKGNVLEMAVGLIMALYFGAIVKSLVDDIIMPPVGYALGGVDFKDLKVVLTEAAPESAPGAGDAVAEVAIRYGYFINHVLTFLIVAFVMFLIVKGYNRMKERMAKEEAARPAPPPAPSKEEQLLTEIRDLLKQRS